MKTLLLMRHAKSSWKNDGQADHERPLNDRGKRDAPNMGRFLQDQGILPDAILASSAKRARKTAVAVAEVLGCADRIETRDELYSASPREYLNILRELPDGVETAMIVAHDPTMSEFVSVLRQTGTEMATGAIACFELSIGSWQEFVPPVPSELRGLWLPGEIPE